MARQVLDALRRPPDHDPARGATGAPGCRDLGGRAQRPSRRVGEQIRQVRMHPDAGGPSQSATAAPTSHGGWPASALPADSAYTARGGAPRLRRLLSSGVGAFTRRSCTGPGAAVVSWRWLAAAVRPGTEPEVFLAVERTAIGSTGTGTGTGPGTGRSGHGAGTRGSLAVGQPRCRRSAGSARPRLNAGELVRQGPVAACWCRLVALADPQW